MEYPARRHQLGRRSILARIAAVLALAACGVAVYLLVMSFTEDEEDKPRNERKNRSEQTGDKKQASANLHERTFGGLVYKVPVLH